jgi:hypothetical protein
MRRIPDRRVLSKMFKTLREFGTRPRARVASERARQQVENRYTFLKWYSIALLLAREDFLHVSVFREHVYGQHCMKMACTHFTHSVRKIYTQGTVQCVLNFVSGYTLIANCFH